MEPLRRDELWTLEAYERARGRIRRAMIALKDRRRFTVGDHLTFLFETRDTVWYQVQEMLRIERIFEEEGIRHELETYNGLMPTATHLSATLLIEYTDVAERDRMLAKLVGLERHLWLEAGDHRAPALFDEQQIDDHALSAVQFIRFDVSELGPGGVLDAAERGALRLGADHWEMTVSAALPLELASGLASDLRGDTPSVVETES